MTSYPKKFTPDQVLAVFADRGVDGKPIDTTNIATKVREAYGVNVYRTDVRGSQDIADALLKLVAAGDLVTSKSKNDWSLRYGNNEIAATEKDQAHLHIVKPGTVGTRFYATPEQSKNWATHLAYIAERNEEAGRIVGKIGFALQSESSAVTWAEISGREPQIMLNLTIEQADLVLEGLRATGPR